MQELVGESRALAGSFCAVTQGRGRETCSLELLFILLIEWQDHKGKTNRHHSLPASLPFLRWADMKRTHYRRGTAGKQVTDSRVWSPLPEASCDPRPGMWWSLRGQWKLWRCVQRTPPRSLLESQQLPPSFLIAALPCGWSPSSGEVLSRSPSVGLWAHCTWACGLRRDFPAPSCSAGEACPPPPGRDAVSSAPRWASPLQDTEARDGSEPEPMKAQGPWCSHYNGHLSR